MEELNVTEMQEVNGGGGLAGGIGGGDLFGGKLGGGMDLCGGSLAGGME